MACIEGKLSMADGRNNNRTIGYVVGAIVLLLLLAWMFGLFGGRDVAEVDDAAEATEEAAEDGAAATGEAVEDAAEATEEAAD